jgi:hypothetical protein
MTYGTIVVCGGGCYGGYYVRQLARARAAGAVRFDRILVVDRDPGCDVARLATAIAQDDASGIATHGWRPRRAAADQPASEAAYQHLPLRCVTSEWAPFFDEWFGLAIADPDASALDAVVPSPLMPHLLADWVASRMRLHQSAAMVERIALASPPETPWQRAAPDMAHYASFATWMCPINCIEPARCPETRGPRDWSMPASVREAADRARAAGTPFDVVAVFQTTHRAYGVGMFDVRDAVETDRSLRSLGAAAACTALVASVSHCHGALAALRAIMPAA